jgi:hypothetical protein
MGDFLSGFGKEESENLRRAREFISDESLPISYVDRSEDEQDTEAKGDTQSAEPDVNSNNGVRNSRGELALRESVLQPPGAAMQDFFPDSSDDLIRSNPYLKAVSTLTPSDLISKFTMTAPTRVQNAVRQTILGLIGSLPKQAFETTTITTGQRLASLMFQLQMTGYLFKNAEYRLSLSQSLGTINSDALSLPASVRDVDDEDENHGQSDPLKGKVKGKLKIRFLSKREKIDYSLPQSSDDSEKNVEEPPVELEVDAAAYMSELRSEVSKLRDELTLRRKEKEETIRKDLLLYIRTLPEQQLRSLTNTISQDVLVAMKGLVNVVMAGIGEGQIAPDTVTEQSGEAMAQLCMWQLAVGYSLRELEVREEMKNSLMASAVPMSAEIGANFSEPGGFD